MEPVHADPAAATPAPPQLSPWGQAVREQEPEPPHGPTVASGRTAPPLHATRLSEPFPSSLSGPSGHWWAPEAMVQIQGKD